MSQVGVSSRPATQMSQKRQFTPHLPEIQHPLSRLGNPEGLNVDVRTSNSRDRPFSQQSVGRPLGAEQSYVSPRKLYSSAGRGESRMRSRLSQQQPAAYGSIPENVEVTAGDPTKTRLPIFGSRTGGESRGNVMSRAASRTSQLSRPATQARLEIDELEVILREKVKSNYFEIRKKFTNNDPEGKGNVSRDALFRIIIVTVSRPITQNVFNRLMDRIGIRDRQVVNFNEFFALFRDVPSREYPRWMDTITRNNDKVTTSAAQVHALLKQKAKQRVLDVAEIVPQLNPDGARRLLKPEFRNALNKMMFYMDDMEFDRLWKMYDPEDSGVINGEAMMKKLGISIEDGMRESARDSPPPKSSRRTPSRPKEVERQRSLDVEKWLKGKFREGFYRMKKEFESLDVAQSGWVTHDEFVSVINNFGLKLEKAHLDVFLARCSVEISKKGVPYTEFLHRFQDRSEAGMPHKILSDNKHRYNVSRGGQTEGGKSTLSNLESRLMNMFQTDFLGLLAAFHKIDKLGLDYISQEEFRAAIESRFSLDMNDDQFHEFIEHVPLDRNGMVKYAEFMGVFDTKGKAKSLYDGTMPKTPRQRNSPRGMEHLGEDTIENRVDRLVVDNDFPMVEVTKRSPQELFKTIKDYLSNNFRQIEDYFYEMDESNSQRMSQEMMYLLLKGTDIQPEITRGEVRDVWKTFITNSDNKLEWLQFIRHFGYSPKSAAFPNAKLSPPKRGDADFMVRSRKLNCAADMLQDNLRSKIDYMWEDLRREFVDMDRFNTGFIDKVEFCDVLTELCVNLSDYEQQMLARKYDINGDGRVSYIEFLKPFAVRKSHWKQGNNMLSLLSHPHAELPINEIVDPPQKGLSGISAKLRQKLTGDWKNLRRAFKKLDVRNDGYLSLAEFRSVLKLANVILDEDEVYHVMDKFDEQLTGKIAYSKFLNETFKPDTRHSTRMPAQEST